MEASNSCAGTLIFGSFFFTVFYQKKFPPLFAFFCLAFYCLFSFFRIGFCFYRPSFFLFFFILVLFLLFFAHAVSSLAYPNLLGTKRLGCCCCCCKLNVFETEQKLAELIITKRKWWRLFIFGGQ